MLCTFCDNVLEENNIARFSCGHTFHLSCVFLNTYQTKCPTCNLDCESLADTGTDRNIAMSASTIANIRARQLKPNTPLTVVQKLSRFVTPLTPKARTFTDHIKQNKRLSCLTEYGFAPRNAVQERVPWSTMMLNYSTQDLLDFGFQWEDMVSMGILPAHIKSFTWSQQKHQLHLNAQKMLQTRMTVRDLADLKYTTHQLIDLGFSWSTLSQMGANVETWPLFKFDLVDIKRYWSPTLSQWLSAGFYDKERIEKSGWPMEEVIQILPAMTERTSGRQLRLAF